jgi:hypothetical protein
MLFSLSALSWKARNGDRMFELKFHASKSQKFKVYKLSRCCYSLFKRTGVSTGVMKWIQSPANMPHCDAAIRFPAYPCQCYPTWAHSGVNPLWLLSVLCYMGTQWCESLLTTVSVILHGHTVVWIPRDYCQCYPTWAHSGMNPLWLLSVLSYMGTQWCESLLTTVSVILHGHTVVWIPRDYCQCYPTWAHSGVNPSWLLSVLSYMDTQWCESLLTTASIILYDHTMVRIPFYWWQCNPTRTQGGA